MSIREIVVISGKGGTGKTSVVASMVPYIENVVVADCDVDAPDLHILLDPKVHRTDNFIGTRKATIDLELCTECGSCVRHCRFAAINHRFEVNAYRCEGCGVCKRLCKYDAVSINDVVIGQVFESTIKYGDMIHAKLIPGEETSGKLVADVRQRAKKLAEEKGQSVVLIDGSPGIGCNVISSITGADKVVIVTEPTQSGLHDLERVVEVARKFSGDPIVVINKYDLSLEMTQKVDTYCVENKIKVALKIPFNRDIVKAISEKQIPSLAESDFFDEIGWKGFVEEL